MRIKCRIPPRKSVGISAGFGLKQRADPMIVREPVVKDDYSGSRGSRSSNPTERDISRRDNRMRPDPWMARLEKRLSKNTER